MHIQVLKHMNILPTVYRRVWLIKMYFKCALRPSLKTQNYHTSQSVLSSRDVNCFHDEVCIGTVVDERGFSRQQTVPEIKLGSYQIFRFSLFFIFSARGSWVCVFWRARSGLN